MWINVFYQVVERPRFLFKAAFFPEIEWWKHTFGQQHLVLSPSIRMLEEYRPK